MKKNILNLYEGFFDDLDKLNPNQDDEFGDVNAQVYDERDIILSPYKNPEFFEGLYNMCKEDGYYPNLPSNENGFTQEDLNQITNLTSYLKSYFQNIFSFKELKYFNNLQKLGPNIFFDNKKVTDLEFPETLKEINYCCFCNCFYLEKIKFPKNLKYISNNNTFLNCKSLKEIIIPKRFKKEIIKDLKKDKVFISNINIIYI